eukprot:TRINITY_DN2595_c0_g3_i3.p1 TRINITY_DN2595_c0_g3~~TRINITY_DN2595_c0_g3_i3.p1  ORF type:complete len:623 (-),score=139.19 TRINITY_DN2595_c0_g3_i3:74-1942(-)
MAMRQGGSPFTEVFCWGNDAYGQLGLCGSVSPREEKEKKVYTVPRVCCFDVVIKQVSCGEEHSTFVTDKGYVYSMGSNLEGRLGIGNRSLKAVNAPCLVEGLLGKRVQALSCGWGHTAAITDDGQLFTWGYGGEGQLGLGGSESQYEPQRVQLPSEAKSVDCGGRHTVVLTVDGAAFVFGNGESGQLGTGRREKELLPVKLDTLSEPLLQVACGISHTLFLGSSGGVWSCGGNTLGQLGIGNKKSASLPIKLIGLDGLKVTRLAAGYHSAAVTEEGEIYVWGTGIFGEILFPQAIQSLKERKIVDVTVGTTFALALDSNGIVLSWGSNNYGELAQGESGPRAEPVEVKGLDGKRVTAISAGGAYAITLGEKVLESPARTEKAAEVVMSPSLADPMATGEIDFVLASTFTQQPKQKSDEDLLRRIEELERENSALRNDVLSRDEELRQVCARCYDLEVLSDVRQREIARLRGLVDELEGLLASKSAAVAPPIEENDAQRGVSPIIRRRGSRKDLFSSNLRPENITPQRLPQNAAFTEARCAGSQSGDIAVATFGPAEAREVTTLATEELITLPEPRSEELNESIKTIKSKLSDLQRNKSALETRMQEFERKLKLTRQTASPIS